MKSVIYRIFAKASLIAIMICAAVGMIVSPNTVSANSLPASWVMTAGGNDADEAKALTVDGAGHSYVVGEFFGSGDFDSGPGTTTLTSAGQSDAFVARYNAIGSLAWAKSIGGSNYDYVSEITLDNTGNVYVVGYFLGTSDFNPGAGTANLTAGVSYTPYLLKLDSSGNYLWAKAFVGDDMAYGTGVVSDGSGNVYITGSYQGTMDADPGAGTSNLVSTGDRDIFAIKLDSTGALVWAKSVGGTGFDHAIKLSKDSSANVYITGMFEGTADFNPGVGTSNLVSNGGRDIYALKLDSSGAFVWAKSVGGTGLDVGNDIYVDSGGNVNLAGYFNDTVDFDPGAGTTSAVSNGASDVFALRLTSAGNLSWVKTFGGESSDEGHTISVNSLGDVVVGGQFFDTVDFDTGAGEDTHTADGGTADGFLALMLSDGTYQWSTGIGGDNTDNVQDSISDVDNNFIVVGKYFGTVDFDGTNSPYEVTSTGGTYDGFVAKFTLAYPPTLDPTTAVVTGSDSVSLSSSIDYSPDPVITARGFQYSIDLSYSDSVSQSGSFGTEAFTLSQTSLSCNTLYNVRAFATTSAGTDTGTATTFTTGPCPTSGSKASAKKSPIPAAPDALVPPIVNAIPSINVTNTPALVPAGMKFMRSLSSGMNGEDVKALQQFLNQNNFTVSESGGGSKGNETTYFGPKTKAALAKFQEFYKADILTPLGLKAGTGYFGQKTKDFVNAVAK